MRATTFSLAVEGLGTRVQASAQAIASAIVAGVARPSPSGRGPPPTLRLPDGGMSQATDATAVNTAIVANMIFDPT